MKTVTVKSFFKKVSAKQAEGVPALSDKIGIKRPDLNWSFQGYDSMADIELIPTEQLAFFLNKALEDHGRMLISDPDNSANWDYLPPAFTLAQVYEALNAETSRSRVLTKVTATAFAKFYSQYAPEILGIKKEAAIAAESVIAGWLSFAKKENIRQAMHSRLEQFALALTELGEDSPVLEAFTDSEIDLAGVLEALIKAFSPDTADAAITADAL